MKYIILCILCIFQLPLQANITEKEQAERLIKKLSELVQAEAVSFHTRLHICAQNLQKDLKAEEKKEWEEKQEAILNKQTEFILGLFVRKQRTPFIFVALEAAKEELEDKELLAVIRKDEAFLFETEFILLKEMEKEAQREREEQIRENYRI